MWIKALLPVAFSAGLMAVSGCNRSVAKPASRGADAYAARAHGWLTARNWDKALEDFDSAVRLRPNDAALLTGRGYTWHMKGLGDDDRPACEERALADYAEALRVDPNFAAALNNRAWILATSKVDRNRDGRKAVEEATRACDLTSWKDAGHIDTLSVAYAEVGDFEQAIRWEKKALEDPSYEEEERDNAREKLALYDKNQPYRE
jgi:tetratricopeptide (TPR) repeat protein